MFQGRGKVRSSLDQFRPSLVRTCTYIASTYSNVCNADYYIVLVDDGGIWGFFNLSLAWAVKVTRWIIHFVFDSQCKDSEWMFLIFENWRNLERLPAPIYSKAFIVIGNTSISTCQITISIVYCKAFICRSFQSSRSNKNFASYHCFVHS